MHAKSVKAQLANTSPPAPVVELELPPAPLLLDELELDEDELEEELDEDELEDEELDAAELVELDDAWVLDVVLPPPAFSAESPVSGFAQLMMSQAPTSHSPLKFIGSLRLGRRAYATTFLLQSHPRRYPRRGRT